MHSTPTINSSQMRSVSSSLSVEASIIWLPCQGPRSAIHSLAEHDHWKLTGFDKFGLHLFAFGVCQWQEKKSDNLTKQADVNVYIFVSTQPLPLSWIPLAKPKLTEVPILHSWLALELAVACVCRGVGGPLTACLQTETQ